MWIFGYGSLIWKVDFPYEYKLIGYIKGYSRRFYQHSIDHRGTADKPGRVVTLIHSTDEDVVWGVAYKIKLSDIPSVLDHLDFREKNGYSKNTVTFHPQDGGIPFDLTIYIATQDNVSYAGEADIESIARQIVECEGPSGTNREYLYGLATAMRQIAPHYSDHHLYQLENAVKKLDKD